MYSTVTVHRLFYVIGACQAKLGHASITEKGTNRTCDAHSCEDVDCRKGPHLRYDINIKKDGVCDISVIK